ncbi:hypothetical protein ACLOJK_036943 [Asimina triloba]
MQKSGYPPPNASSFRGLPQLPLRRLGSRCSQIATGQHSSPTVFPEKRGKVKSLRHTETNVASEDPERLKSQEHRIDIGNEQSDLLGDEVYVGKLVLDKRTASANADGTITEAKNQEGVDAKLTRKALVWGSHMLYLEDVISVMSSKKQGSDMVVSDFPPEQQIKCKSPPTILVILNPRSGHGRSSKVFHGKVEPIFKLAGFKMEVVKTTSAGHARSLATNVDFSTCPDGIICVGGDGLVNEVLNGLLSRNDQKEAISIPIGIIPSGSDNSLAWTVLGVRDPVSAAIAIVKVVKSFMHAMDEIKSAFTYFSWN